MKNLELSNYGVAEMNQTEMKAVDGGVVLFFLGVWLALEMTSAWQAGQDDKQN